MQLSPLNHWQEQASAILSGFLGDWLNARANPLAIDMQLFCGGKRLSLAADPLLPEDHPPRRTLILLVHGLTELESIWDFPGQPGHNYATALSGHLGADALTLRYNSGRAIHDNGRDLADLLEQLVLSWPVPVENLVLIGHSMGGLLIRSACHYGAQASRRWVEAVDSCVYVGSPHDGSWLARLAQGTAGLMEAMPRDYLQAVSDLINLRSDGIRDLNQGHIVEPDGEQPPLLPSARHYAVSGLLSRQHKHPLNRLLGDALVHEDSARGLGQPGWQLSDAATFPGIDHIRLAHHPDVLTQLEAWLR